MGFQTPRTWVNRQVVTAAQMNQDVRDNVQFLYDILHGTDPGDPGGDILVHENVKMRRRIDGSTSVTLWDGRNFGNGRNIYVTHDSKSVGGAAAGGYQWYYGDNDSYGPWGLLRWDSRMMGTGERCTFMANMYLTTVTVGHMGFVRLVKVDTSGDEYGSAGTVLQELSIAVHVDGDEYEEYDMSTVDVHSRWNIAIDEDTWLDSTDLSDGDLLTVQAHVAGGAPDYTVYLPSCWLYVEYASPEDGTT
jgi:hypothetical protein